MPTKKKPALRELPKIPKELLEQFGAGHVRPTLQAPDSDCLIVASLGKSFGASGGLVMLGSERQVFPCGRAG